MAKPVTANSKYLTDVQAGERFAVDRTTIWRWTRTNPAFPKPVKVSAGSTRWRLADIEAFEATREAASHTA
ncbi:MULTISPECIES: AlpA family phage regulatory protein [unclassified Mesorhizobium]|uniref:helix-turn-helix transcriptional regulator n=1 Tax=unclassified Mesorhizobium TaxID=325217 RepID=UPI000FCC06D4|nr:MULTISPECIES: AlpA family phage regulatory protein [unclassified Mesorhizobium]RUW72455.1 AlpA family phage regulatory protein [Mesorhizobium sp. M4B.F.Ca.ET.049.02.1.2]RWC95632.1 MAG: AlpA family phage regulatory protein [Mesorhizobium sp.]TGV22341.1 AlpA family phage regulatory protein [Mesorhizobium sp. M4B.F.Ca.ET.143.01.1.1]